MPLPAFKAYDLRGRVPDELNPALACDIGIALAGQLPAGAIVLGRDVRLSSPDLQAALSDGLRSQGRDVIRYYPLAAIAPGVAITLVVLSFSIVGDGLRDALDPRLKNS